MKGYSHSADEGYTLFYDLFIRQGDYPHLELPQVLQIKQPS